MPLEKASMTRASGNAFVMQLTVQNRTKKRKKKFITRVHETLKTSIRRHPRAWKLPYDL